MAGQNLTQAISSLDAQIQGFAQAVGPNLNPDDQQKLQGIVDASAQLVASSGSVTATPKKPQGQNLLPGGDRSGAPPSLGGQPPSDGYMG